jgi:hypothetical protein
MYHRPLVPDGFDVPDGLEWQGHRLRMLSIDDVEKDFEAVTASADRIRGLLDPASPWPGGLTLKEDLIDLAWHQREFTLRHSFAFTLMASDECRCLGCFYIFPSNAAGYEAVAYYWVRSGDDADRRDRELGLQVREWLAQKWPFKHVAFPGRDIAWADWHGLHRVNSGP